MGGGTSKDGAPVEGEPMVAQAVPDHIEQLEKTTVPEVEGTSASSSIGKDGQKGETVDNEEARELEEEKSPVNEDSKEVSAPDNAPNNGEQGKKEEDKEDDDNVEGDKEKEDSEEGEVVIPTPPKEAPPPEVEVDGDETLPNPDNQQTEAPPTPEEEEEKQEEVKVEEVEAKSESPRPPSAECKNDEPEEKPSRPSSAESKKEEKGESPRANSSAMSSELSTQYEEGTSDESQFFHDCLCELQNCDKWTQDERSSFINKLKNWKKLDFLVDGTDDFGNTLLLLSTMGRQAEIVELLLQNGAEPNHQNDAGFCALHYCAPVQSEDAFAIVRLLLQYGANCNLIESKAGCSPLHYAASENNREAVDMLLRHGALPSLKCKGGFLPEAYSRAAGHNELADYLHKKTMKKVSKQVKAKLARQKENNGGHGWEEHKDTETGRSFYFNTRTQKSSWDRPVELDIAEGKESEEDSSSSEDEEVIVAPGSPKQRATKDKEKRKLKQQLEDMQKRLLEAEEVAKREQEQVALLQQVAKEADEKFANEMKQLKFDLENRATNEEESQKQMEKLKLQFEVQKKNELDKLRIQFDKEKEEELKKMEELQELERQKHREEIEKQVEELRKLEEQLQKELKEKKEYRNEIEELKGSIRVCARIRPLSTKELERGCDNVLEVCGSNLKMVYTRKTKAGEKKEHKMWSFDRVMGPTRSQEDVFSDMSRLVQSAIDGYNVCIFAYGQTGAGKTYTMGGSPENPGILPRTVSTLYEFMGQQSDMFDFSIEFYMLELHLNSLVDLLDERGRKKKIEGKDLSIKKDQFGVVYVENINVINIESQQQLSEHIKIGENRRKTTATDMNDESSRSHLVISIVIKSENKKSGEITSGKLTLVDLAGSERVAKSNAEGETFKEATSINKALSALGEVINALTTKAKHVPYRNNCLTQLMSDSIGGNAKTLMIVNVSPADYNANETISSLNFATRCKSVNNAASKGFETKELAALRREIAKLRKEK